MNYQKINKYVNLFFFGVALSKNYCLRNITVVLMIRKRDRDRRVTVA